MSRGPLGEKKNQTVNTPRRPRNHGIQPKAHTSKTLLFVSAANALYAIIARGVRDRTPAVRSEDSRENKKTKKKHCTDIGRNDLLQGNGRGDEIAFGVAL